MSQFVPLSRRFFSRKVGSRTSKTRNPKIEAFHGFSDFLVRSCKERSFDRNKNQACSAVFAILIGQSCKSQNSQLSKSRDLGRPLMRAAPISPHHLPLLLIFSKIICRTKRTYKTPLASSDATLYHKWLRSQEIFSYFFGYVGRNCGVMRPFVVCSKA